MLLFHPTPEQWFPGAYAKIAYFPNDADIAYMDEVRVKYMKSAITYEDINRAETPPFPRPAVREAVLNATAHSCYASGIPMQIRVYGDKLHISNSPFGMEGGNGVFNLPPGGRRPCGSVPRCGAAPASACRPA